METIIENFPGASCWLWHRWHTVKDNGKTRYQECRDCPARRALQREGGYQPVSTDWVFRR